MNSQGIILTIILICFCTSNLNAGMCCWTDKNGIKHFTNAAPPQDVEEFEESYEEEYVPPVNQPKIEEQEMQEIKTSTNTDTYRPNQVITYDLIRMERKRLKSLIQPYPKPLKIKDKHKNISGTYAHRQFLKFANEKHRRAIELENERLRQAIDLENNKTKNKLKLLSRDPEAYFYGKSCKSEHLGVNNHPNVQINPSKVQVVTKTKPQQVHNINKGAIDPYSGTFYPPAGENIIDPKTGTLYTPVAGGYVNIKTGQFVPAH